MASRKNKKDKAPVPAIPSLDSIGLPMDLIALKPPQTWSVNETAAWLESIDLPELKRQFIDQEVSGSELLELTDHDLREMGVDKLGHRKKIIRRIHVLRGDAVEGTSSSFLESSASENQSLESSRSEDSATTSTNTYHITLRCLYKAEVYTVKYTKETTYKSLRRELKRHFGCPLRIKFKDTDGDAISIKREADLAECIKSAQVRGIRRMKLYLSERDKTHIATEKAKTDQMKSEMFAFFECILDPVIIISELGIIQFVNTRVKEMLGFDPSEMVGRNVDMIVPDNIRPYHDEYIRTYLKTGVSRIIGKGREVIGLAKDGSLIPIYLEVSERTMANGSVYWIGVLKKVQAKVTEKSLIQQEREVLDTLIVPAVIIDEKGNIHGFNKAAVKFFGYELVDVLVRNVSMLMPSPHAESHNQYLQNYLTTRKAKIIGTGRKVVAQLKDGSIRPVFLTVTEKQEKDKRFFTGILQDAGL